MIENLKKSLRRYKSRLIPYPKPSESRMILSVQVLENFGQERIFRTQLVNEELRRGHPRAVDSQRSPDNRRHWQFFS
jgi:hypothetical protein